MDGLEEIESDNNALWGLVMQCVSAAKKAANDLGKRAMDEKKAEAAIYTEKKAKEAMEKAKQMAKEDAEKAREIESQKSSLAFFAPWTSLGHAAIKTFDGPEAFAKSITGGEYKLSLIHISEPTRLALI
eukprot:668691-Alexandrium_andersonii.AAC.1